MYEIEPRYNNPRFNNLSNTISLSYYPKPFGRKDGIKVKQVTYSAVRNCCFNAPSKFSENSQILSPYIKIHKFSGLQETKSQPPSRRYLRNSNSNGKKHARLEEKGHSSVWKQMELP